MAIFFWQTEGAAGGARNGFIVDNLECAVQPVPVRVLNCGTSTGCVGQASTAHARLFTINRLRAPAAHQHALVQLNITA